MESSRSHIVSQKSIGSATVISQYTAVVQDSLYHSYFYFRAYATEKLANWKEELFSVYE